VLKAQCSAAKLVAVSMDMYNTGLGGMDYGMGLGLPGMSHLHPHMRPPMPGYPYSSNPMGGGMPGMGPGMGMPGMGGMGGMGGAGMGGGMGHSLGQHMAPGVGGLGAPRYGGMSPDPGMAGMPGGMDRRMQKGGDEPGAGGMGGCMGQGMDQRRRKGEKGDMGGPGGSKGFGKGGCAGMEFGKGGYGMDDGMGSGMPSVPKDAKGLIREALSSQTVPGGRWDNDENTLFIGGLPSNMTSLDMYHMFSSFGPIAPRGATAMIDKEADKCTGIGFVNFMEPEAAQTATRALNGFPLPDGTWLTVKKKGPPKNKKDGEGEGKGKGRGKGKGKGGGKGKEGKELPAFFGKPV